MGAKLSAVLFCSFGFFAADEDWFVKVQDLIVGGLEPEVELVDLLLGFVKLPLNFLDLMLWVFLTFGQVCQLLLIVHLHLLGLTLLGIDLGLEVVYLLGWVDVLGRQALVLFVQPFLLFCQLLELLPESVGFGIQLVSFFGPFWYKALKFLDFVLR